MENEPFNIAGQRVRWAVSELKKAGIDAEIKRSSDGQYLISVSDSERKLASETLLPVQTYTKHPLLQQKQRQNAKAGILYTILVAAIFGGLLWLSAAGAIPFLTGVAVFGFSTVAAVAVGGVIVMIVVALWMTNLKINDAIIYLVVGAFVLGVGVINPLAWPLLLLAVVTWFVVDRWVIYKSKSKG